MYYAVICDCGGWAKRHTFTDIDSANDYALKHIENECYLKHEIVVYAIEEISRYGSAPFRLTNLN